MKPDEVSTVKFTLDPISIGRKDISFELTYKNGDNIHSESLTCSIDVTDSPEVRLILVETPALVSKGEIARISLDVANAKLSEITGVSVIPVTEVVLAPSEAFIGTMEPDDVFSANFDVDTTDLSLGKHDIDFKVAYKDGERFYETAVYTVSFNVVEAPTTELPPIPLLISILVVVALVTGYCVYRRKRSKTQ
ncbi:MAG: hypothetical protein QMC85_06640 [Methanocellales archaeon]|nr:hypothetical protein [Methanocellales archaeon]